ncbi:MAG: diaminopimelate decarboxylase [Candidatus Sedimenticola endophacoides]|uniref:Diaminopimelate decarboxylase n=2 Tax=Candidatus Sedimenticola endophacoides TaxID=2548426 RepID=A0A6N4E6B3_9GAMM|nr:MAG: diaminopimelate decarboxylase [Candidatus Sedimenticola endophacoides]OQX34151.1 MAG: diaminopimelate decarboxylase [Candidatus Sedimenticola endophacoides]OQX42166.1 MAG: diaminopimelate decarboxylase [Candidatus Sedimenticola endophacoides]OQX44965.1 MAG: diaminopimelate decarboxylase [Candidatus Sedimenticola endophacoides]PUE00761.1 MAG: diaminopimelate decarboxylase [Candidatus Sedimenticola endophacoides]
MDHFNYRDDQLYAEEVPLARVAERFGTPCYVYSRATLERHWHAFDDAFRGRPHLICYAVKANSNLAVLNLFARLGSGFDIVSQGELERVLAAGGDPGKVVFSGVGKRHQEMRRALEVGIRCFNVESAAELERLDQVAGEMGRVAPVALRVNPDVDAKTHPYISTGLKENKFGIDIDQALKVYQRARALPNLRISGVDCHIGSQLTDTGPFLDALDRLMSLVARLKATGIEVDHLDLGGGLGIRYTDEQPPQPAEYARAIAERLGEVPYEIFIEPGRAIAGNAGVLLTRVEYLKQTPAKEFALIDAAMNDLLRPTLYQARQEIVPVRRNGGGRSGSYDLVGPICETGDFLGKERRLELSEGDLLAVRSSGAYGFTMSSNYNSRPRAPEVMVDGDQMHLVRRRERIEELYLGEQLLP